MRTVDPAEQHAKRRLAAGEPLSEKEAQTMEDNKNAAEARERNERHRTVARHLDTAAVESLLFLTKAFQRAVPMDEPENRMLLSAASSTVGAWSRLQATESAEKQTVLLRAGIFARDLGGKQTDYIEDAPKARLKAVGDFDRV